MTTERPHDTRTFLVQPATLRQRALTTDGWYEVESDSNGWSLGFSHAGAVVRVELPVDDTTWATRVQVESAVYMLASHAGLPAYEFAARLVNEALAQERDLLIEQRNNLLGALAPLALLGRDTDPNLGPFETNVISFSVNTLRRAWQVFTAIFDQGADKPQSIQEDVDPLLREFNLDRTPQADQVLFLAQIIRQLQTALKVRDIQAENYAAIAEIFADTRVCAQCDQEQLCLRASSNTWLCMDRQACDERAKPD